MGNAYLIGYKYVTGFTVLESTGEKMQTVIMTMSKEPDRCGWEWQGNAGRFLTLCKNEFYDDYDSLNHKNRMYFTYCPYCGKEIEEIKK